MPGLNRAVFQLDAAAVRPIARRYEVNHAGDASEPYTAAPPSSSKSMRSRPKVGIAFALYEVAAPELIGCPHRAAAVDQQQVCKPNRDCAG